MLISEYLIDLINKPEKYGSYKWIKWLDREKGIIKMYLVCFDFFTQLRNFIFFVCLS